MNSTVPVTYLASSDSRDIAPYAISFGSPRSPIGICALYHSTCSGVTFACIGVFMPPGTMVFTRTPCPTYSSAATLVIRSEEHTSELQSLMRISYAVFCLKKKTQRQDTM